MVHYQLSCSEIVITGASDVVTGHQNKIWYRGPEDGMLIVVGHGNTIVRDMHIIGSLVVDGDHNNIGVSSHHVSARGYNNNTIGDAVAGVAIIQWSHNTTIAPLPEELFDGDDKDDDVKNRGQDMVVTNVRVPYNRGRLRRYVEKLFLKNPVEDSFTTLLPPCLETASSSSEPAWNDLSNDRLSETPDPTDAQTAALAKLGLMHLQSNKHE